MERALLFLVSTLFCLAIAAAGLAAEPAAKISDAEDGSAAGMDLFEAQIKPVLVKHCYECHSKGGKDIEGGLELDSPSGMARGGDSGPIFVAHKVDQSPLLRMLRHEKGVEGMPPEHRLPDEVVTAFAEWIRLGAPDSRTQTGPTVKQQRDEAAQRHWAFQPPGLVEPPVVQLTDWPRDSGIDNFILARIEADGLKPVADANRRTLVRRVYFDLVGLPPSPEEVAAFMADDAPSALSDLVDRLLESPQFGERWGRHWLDVVRYAESSGMEFNFTYPHAWPYRNYVIDAFNQDKPFDVFLREQVAGDLMPAGEEESSDAQTARRIATSMLAFGPKRHNSSGTEFQIDIADDQINTVTRATMAMTVACARCHDHKFDPIPTKDYYALAGIFLSTEPLYGTIKQKYSNNPTDLLPIGPNADKLHAAAEQHGEKLKELEKTQATKKAELKKAAEAEKLATKKKADAAEKLAAIEQAGAAEQEELEQATKTLREATDLVAKLTAEVAELEGNVGEMKKNNPPRPPYAMSVRDRAKPADTKIALRGDYRSRGDVVPRGFLSAIAVASAPKVNPSASGRLELAQWISSPDNPLTARVMVNRIWHHLFGRGIVPTVDNFGVIGKSPSHPQLLDALAVRFVREGWSVKRMIRAIMLSRTYQLSSVRNADNMAIDPDNRLLWRATPRRLQAEVIRDAMLAVSGQLDLERPVGSTVTPLGDKLVRGIGTDKLQPPSVHRSVYLPVVRDYVPELFDHFDFPSPSLVSGRRSVTNVPSQALYLRNSAFAAEQARHAASRLLASKATVDDAGRVDLAMRWALARGATDAERSSALQLVQQVREAQPDDGDVVAWAAWFHTLFTTAEFRYLVDIQSGAFWR